MSVMRSLIPKERCLEHPDDRLDDRGLCFINRLSLRDRTAYSQEDPP